MTLEDLAEDPTLEKVRSLARKRLIAALSGKEFHTEDLAEDPKLEVHSFVAAKLIASEAGPQVLARLANYEAKRFLRLCQRLSLDQLKALAKEAFGVELKGDAELWIDLASYLKGASKIGGRKWRLVNRVVVKGYVSVNRYELERILSEYVRDNVLRTRRVDLPENLKRISEEIAEIFKKSVPKSSKKGNEREIPPCIREVMEKIRRGENVSHQARFAVTAYLLSIGWKEEQILDFLRSLPDFKEKVAAYQVSHIAKKKYKPPSCETLMNWGLCLPDCGRRRG